jgi:hypothetical protein
MTGVGLVVADANHFKFIYVVFSVYFVAKFMIHYNHTFVVGCPSMKVFSVKFALVWH